MQKGLGNPLRLLPAIATIAAVFAAPLVSLGHVIGNGDHAVCMMAMQRCGSACCEVQEQTPPCCEKQAASDERRPTPAPEDSDRPCDGSTGCHCCIVMCGGAAPATVNQWGYDPPRPPSALVSVSIETFVHFVWVDSLLRPPQS